MIRKTNLVLHLGFDKENEGENLNLLGWGDCSSNQLGGGSDTESIDVNSSL